MSATTGHSPQDMAARGRIGGYTKASRYPPQELTAAARFTFLSRFEREVDPEGVLPVAERLRRAEAAKRAYFARLALKSARARRRRAAKPARGGTDVANA